MNVPPGKTKDLLMKKIMIIVLLLVSATAMSQQFVAAENFSEYLPLLKKKNVAVVANKASVVYDVNVVDTLFHLGIKIKKIFSPEHGFREYSEAGAGILNLTDKPTGLPVVSLYGKKKKPEPEDFKGIDIVVFDIQDVGVRFFTYISTLSYVMEACAENNVPLIVLDRANPNIFYIDGPVLEPEQRSFVGLHPVPVVYGMTIGEYAMMVNGEKWLKDSVRCKLTVIPLKNYTHQTKMQELPVAPSPNLKNLNAIYLYPSLCLFEGTQVSVGRGTDYPFEIYGHPDFKGYSFSFTPLPKEGSSLNPVQNGRLCIGEDLRQFYNIHPKLLGRINLIWLFKGYRMLGSKPEFFNDFFDKLAGTSSLRQQILESLSGTEINKSWQPGIEKFKKVREKYLLYPEM